MTRLAVVCVVIAGCKTDVSGKDDVDAVDADRSEGDADADADADSDSDTDTDTDSDADTDTGTGSLLDCSADYLSAMPPYGADPLGSCVTEEVGCGSVVFGTNTGGSTIFDYEFSEGIFALGSLLGDIEALDGPERVYIFRGLSVDESVEFRVDACFDVWGTWVRHGDVQEDFCSVGTFNIGGLFEERDNGDQSRWTLQSNLASSSDYDFEFIVEGLEGAEGNYMVTVTCFP